MKNSKKNHNNFRSKKIFSNIIIPLFLLVSAVVLVGSGCADEDFAGDDFSYEVVFSSPTKNAIYYTNNINEAGGSLGPDVVEIRASVISEYKSIRYLQMKIKNSASEEVYNKIINTGSRPKEFSFSETFQTTVPDDYTAVILTFLAGRQLPFADAIEFTYENPSFGGGTDN